MDSDRCAVAGCQLQATGSYLYAALARAIQFAVCDVHLAQLMAGSAPEITDGAGRQATLLIRDGGADR